MTHIHDTACQLDRRGRAPPPMAPKPSQPPLLHSNTTTTKHLNTRLRTTGHPSSSSLGDTTRHPAGWPLAQRQRALVTCRVVSCRRARRGPTAQRPPAPRAKPLLLISGIPALANRGAMSVGPCPCLPVPAAFPVGHPGSMPSTGGPTRLTRRQARPAGDPHGPRPRPAAPCACSRAGC